MNLSDTFYVALCMTVLIIGLVYWVWTQNQYIQRKLNLLENIVYDMKSSMNFGNQPPDPVSEVLAAAAAHKPVVAAAVADMPDIADEEADHGLINDVVNFDNDEDVDRLLNAMTEAKAPLIESRDISGADSIGTPIIADELLDDLQPGGGAGIETDVSDTSNESVLNAMGMKELKELAKQKNIAGAKTMRKHELVAAIRASKMNVTPFEVREGTLDLN